MRYKKITNYFFEKNRQKLSRRLPILSVAIVIANDEMPRTADQFFPFRQNSNLFYLSGIEQPRTILCLCPDYHDHSFHEILFIEKPSERHQTWYGKQLGKEQASELSGIKSVHWLESFEQVLSELMKHAKHVYISLQENNRSFDEVPLREFRFTQKIKDLYPLHQYQQLSPCISELRQIKEPEETDLIKTAIAVTEKTFFKIVGIIKPSINEYEIEAEIIAGFIRNGASGHAFQPIVASGKNACILHYTENKDSCNGNDLVLIDFGAELANYNADVTRTLPVSGTFTKRQRDVYEAVLRLHDKAVSLIKPGTTIEKINQEIAPFFEEEMISLGLLARPDIEKQDTEKPLFKKYFMHGISHYLGLDVHDVGNKTDLLVPGMIITCEPGLYIREENLGIRLENDILLTEHGNINLTAGIPIQPDDIEKLMAQFFSKH
jgi:Xaa-Pro aminopeptidase